MLKDENHKDNPSKHRMYLVKLLKVNCCERRRKEAGLFFFFLMMDKGLGECFQIIFFAVCCAYEKSQLSAEWPGRETGASQATGE